MAAAVSRTMHCLLPCGLLVCSLPHQAGAQDVDKRLLTVPSADALKCTDNSRASGPGSKTVLILYRYHIGVPKFQMRNSAGETVVTGPSPRVAVAVFDQQGKPIGLVDSVFAGWTTWAAMVQFDSTSRGKSYLQASSVDSVEAMAIAMRLGPTRLMEIGDSAERIRRFGPKQQLDAEVLRRASELARLLWRNRCS